MSKSSATEQIMYDEMMRVRKHGKYSPHESNYTRLFGTPERAARTLSVMQRCELGIIGNCDKCDMHDACMVRDGDYDALLEWLGGDA